MGEALKGRHNVIANRCLAYHVPREPQIPIPLGALSGRLSILLIRTIPPFRKLPRLRALSLAVLSYSMPQKALVLAPPSATFSLAQNQDSILLSNSSIPYFQQKVGKYLQAFGFYHNVYILL